MRRVVVVGQSGSGKSTLARRLAEHLRVRHIELDALFHGPGWVPNPRFADPAWVHLDVVRVRTPAEVTRWLTQL